MTRRIVLADDHAVVRAGLRAVFADVPEVEIVAEARDGLEAIALCRRHSPDLVTLDAAMPHSSGIEAYGEIRRWSPDTRICLLTGFTSAGIAAQWIGAGVDGYVLEGCEAEEMALAFRIVPEGGRYVAPAVEAALRAGPVTETLSPREAQVLALIAEGLSNAEIGERLSISAKTAENHRTRMTGKLGVGSTACLTALALREGLLDGEAQRGRSD